MPERPLRLGTFLAPALWPEYEAAADALDAELVHGGAFAWLEDGTLDAAFLCGLPYAGLDGVEALVAPALAGDAAPVYWSDVVARPGDAAAAIQDFAGRRLAINEPGSHSGANVVLATLAERGIAAGAFAEVVETGSHAASLAAVREDRADVAAIDSHVLAAIGADGIEVIERLGPSPSPPLAAGAGLGADRREEIRATLTALPPSPLGLTWHRVDDSTYDPIRAMRAAAEARGGF